jgi:hypothetical protein
MNHPVLNLRVPQSGQIILPPHNIQMPTGKLPFDFSFPHNMQRLFTSLLQA